jgi:glycosyltransferase involved in cell wall biosynthesis
MPVVSVIIPAYNSARYLAGAIGSALNQTMQDFEIIVVDDGSKDDTPIVVQPFLADPRIRYLRQENRGVSAARNVGAKLSQAKYLAFVDSDDALALNALGSVLTELDRSKSSWCLIDVWKSYGDHYEVQRTQVPSGNYLYEILQDDFIRRGIFFERTDFLEVGMYDETLSIREDWDINIRMFEKRKSFSYIPEPLYVYTHRPGSLTKSGRRGILSCTEKVLKKHHKRLADVGNKYISEIYARNMWDLARNYFYDVRDSRGALRCLAESLRYDLNISRLVHPLVHRVHAALGQR